MSMSKETKTLMDEEFFKFAWSGTFVDSGARAEALRTGRYRTAWKYAERSQPPGWPANAIWVRPTDKKG